VLEMMIVAEAKIARLRADSWTVLRGLVEPAAPSGPAEPVAPVRPAGGTAGWTGSLE
jgi:hypothetical protein